MADRWPCGVEPARCRVPDPVGFRSVKLISEAAAALPLVLQDMEQRYDQHPILALIKQPNPGQGRAELMEALFAQLLLSGNANVEAVAGESGSCANSRAHHRWHI
jgi:phage portal protein BeeE